METMYDRLGDLLNETLEAGHVKYVYVEGDDKDSPEDNDKSPQEEKKASETDSEGASGPVNSKNARKHRIIRKITPEIQRAYRLLDITVSATPEEVKKAYKEKLKYYHPDKYQHNPKLQKIATDKTRQVVEAYSIILNFLQ